MSNKAGAPPTKRHDIRQTRDSWLRALEQADSDKPFLSPEHMASFRYLPGFKTEQSAENSFLFRVYDDQGKPIEGNLNSDYNNAGLSEADLQALVEYMKGL